MTIVVAAAATGLVGLAGCADRPNDLDTYYDDPEQATAAPAPAGSPSLTVEADWSRDPSGPEPSAPTAELVAEAERAILAESDVQAEGVVRGQPTPDPEHAGHASCLLGIPAGLGRQQPELTRWDYPTGSALTQFVTAYPGRPAADVLADGAPCEGEGLTLAPVKDVDAQGAWCAETSCAVVLTRGSVLSAIEVTASDRQRALEALQRLTPVAASVLAGQP
ncbi:hypothetical protein [Prauserella marina]|uniref:hypothetical protein n=1 Tax=Prauserella marina TaxID=530584 RepID=UPI000B88EBE4|nr:hypothetical protein [Prauserella marina]